MHVKVAVRAYGVTCIAIERFTLLLLSLLLLPLLALGIDGAGGAMSGNLSLCLRAADDAGELQDAAVELCAATLAVA